MLNRSKPYTGKDKEKTLYIHKYTDSQFDIIRVIFSRFLLIIILLYIYNNIIINIFQKKGMPEYQTVNLLIVIIHRFTDSQFYIPFIP